MPGKINDSINCQVHEVKLGDVHPCNPYSGLSYCCGASNLSVDISLNGEEHRTGQNLSTALCHLRSEDVVRTFWIDAIDIN